MFSKEEIIETIRMILVEHLNVRAVTLGISLLDCVSDDFDAMRDRIERKISGIAERFVKEAKAVEEKYGIPIVNKRIAVTPASALLGSAIRGIPDEEAVELAVELARALDEGAGRAGVDFIGGYGALVQKGCTRADSVLMRSIPKALSSTERVCSCVNIASTRAGINVDAAKAMGEIVLETARATADENGIGCCKLAAFANAPEDNPFMAGAYHGLGEPESVVNVGISGPAVIRAAVEQSQGEDFRALAERIKRTAFKITRVGELVGREMAKRLGVRFGIVDLSLAPTPEAGESVADIIEAMGIESCGAPGSTAALALLTDAVKKGGAMATSFVGGLSGAFIPVSEDAGMKDALRAGSLTLEKLEAMTSVCSVGLDMIAIPGDTPPETISAIIMDGMAIGVVNDKPIGVRLIPVPGKRAGDAVEFGGLFGSAIVMPVSRFSPSKFIGRGGQIPSPISSLRG
ncbi:MAG: PFL family protein [Candidatus Bathyarchaeia archaeon]